MEVQSLSRGTTPCLTFKADLDCTYADALYLTLKSDNGRKLEKTIRDIEIQGNVIKCKLSQEDTLYFKKTEYIEMEIRVLLGKSALVSNKIMVKMEDILKNGVI